MLKARETPQGSETRTYLEGCWLFWRRAKPQSWAFLLFYSTLCFFSVFNNLSLEFYATNWNKFNFNLNRNFGSKGFEDQFCVFTCNIIKHRLDHIWCFEPACQPIRKHREQNNKETANPQSAHACGCDHKAILSVDMSVRFLISFHLEFLEMYYAFCFFWVQWKQKLPNAQCSLFHIPDRACASARVPTSYLWDVTLQTASWVQHMTCTHTPKTRPASDLYRKMTIHPNVNVSGF